MRKLTPRQIRSIPELMKTRGVTGAATKLGVHRVTVQTWARKLRQQGVNVPKGKAGPRPTLS